MLLKPPKEASHPVHPPSRGEHVLDVETYWPRPGEAPEVGMPLDLSAMRVSCCVVHDLGTGRDLAFAAERVEGAHTLEALYFFLEACRSEGCSIVGHNLRGFDWEVLAAEFEARGLVPHRAQWGPGAARLVDTLAALHQRLGWRPSLQLLAWHNLGETKSMSGADAPAAWRAGKRQEVIAHCRRDVDLTRRVWERGRAEGRVVVDRRPDGTPVHADVQW